MFVRKRLDKKGQQLSTTAMILLVLGVILLVVIAMAVMRYYGFLGEKIEILPGDLEAIAQSCEVSASQGLVTSYCNEFKELGKQYVNCNYAQKNLGAVVPSATQMANKCVDVPKLEVAFCLKTEMKIIDVVNGKKCETILSLENVKKVCDKMEDSQSISYLNADGEMIPSSCLAIRVL